MTSEERLRLSMASVGSEELSEIEKVLRQTVNFGLGIHVKEFEEAICDFLGSDLEVVCVNTGTAALHIALETLGFPRGSEVLVPSLTFLASYSAISAAGLVPVSCEVTFPDCHIDVDDASRRVNEKTVAIMPVSYAGCDFDRSRIYALAKRYNLRVVEDNAHAFGGINRDNKRFGASGDITCFSFDGIKNITCGEGGAIVTRDKEFARGVKIRRSLGIEQDVDLRYKGTRAWEYDVKVQGFRYHMSNINAAIGLAQIKKFDQFATKKRELFNLYTSEIRKTGLGDILLSTQNPSSLECLHIFSCILPHGVTRASVRSKLLEQNIESGFHYVPNHTHSMYRSSYTLPVAEDLGARLISLPFHPAVPIDMIPKIIKLCAEEINGSLRNN